MKKTGLMLLTIVVAASCGSRAEKPSADVEFINGLRLVDYRPVLPFYLLFRQEAFFNEFFCNLHGIGGSSFSEIVCNTPEIETVFH